MNRKRIYAFLIASLVSLNLFSSLNFVNVFAEENIIRNAAVYAEEEIPRSQMIVSASSYEPSDAPSKAIDGNLATIWHTPWDGSAILPQSLTIDLGGTNNVSSMKVTPRVSTSNGIITKYEIYAIKGENEVKVASGKWDYTNTPKNIVFDEAVSADKIKIVALEGVGNYASIAEVNIFRKVGEIEKIVGEDNKRITSEADTINQANKIEALKNLQQGTIIARFDSNSSDIQTLFGVSNDRTNNGYFSLYVTGSRVGAEIRTQSREGNTSEGTTNITHRYVDVQLNQGINTVALKVQKGVGYKIFVNGKLAGDFADTNASLFSAVQGANSAFVGKANRLNGNKYIFNGDIDFIDVYGELVSDNYLLKRTGETAIPNEKDFIPDTIHKTEPEEVFYPGYLGSNNYRIPALLTTNKGTVISSIDARISNGSDSPNNIDSAVRRKVLNSDGTYGEWEEGKIVINFPENASTIDTALLQDEETDRIFLLVTTFPTGYGFGQAKVGSGYTTVEKDGVPHRYRSLYDRSNNLYTIRENGIVYDANGNETEYKVTENNMDLFRGENKVDNVMTSTSPLKSFGTSYLSLIYSDDDGVTWSDPVDLNKEVKSDWMKFLGTGPGRGIQIKNGQHAGRLVFPVYLTNSSGFQSSVVVYSDDNGQTWEIGETANDGRDLGNGQFGNAQTMNSGLQLTEAQLVEMPNGQLKMFMRNTGTYVRIATSFDGGATWDPEVYEDTNLREPYCQLSVINYSSKIDGKDAIIFSNPNASNRSNGTVRIGLINETGTHANGQPKYTFEWKYNKSVKSGHFAYSCLTELADGNIGLFYEGTDNTVMSYMEMDVDYIKYNVDNSIPVAAIKSVSLLDADNEYLPGEDINVKVEFNQTVSLLGDKKLTLDINGKEVELDLIPNENSKVYSFVGKVPEDLENGQHALTIKANPNTRLLNIVGNNVTLNEDKALDVTIRVGEKEEVNKDAIKMAIDYAEKVKIDGELDNVVPAVVSEFNSALELAKGVYENVDATETEVNEAFLRLVNVIHMLEFKKGDKEALENLIAMAEALNSNSYTTESWGNMQIELRTAKIVFNDENAMQEEVNDATNKLKAAIDNLEVHNVNKNNLQKLINTVKGLNKEKYTEVTWNEVEAKLHQAEAILDNRTSTQEEVDQAYNALLRSYLQLRYKADKTMLNELINKVTKMDFSKYSLKNVQRINKALNSAVEIAKKEDVTQKEVDEAVKALETVIKEVALENTEEKDKVSLETDTTKTTDKTTENKNTNSKLPNTGGVQTGIFGVISALAGLGLLKKRNNKK